MGCVARDGFSGSTHRFRGESGLDLGPKALKGFEDNWLETIPGKSFLLGLRLYGPLEPWIEKT